MWRGVGSLETVNHPREKFTEAFILLFYVCRYAVPEPYEKLKAFTRGQRVTEESMRKFVNDLEDVPEEAKAKLMALTPMSYIGNAIAQTHDLTAKLADVEKTL